jgi:membrane protease YdiL (CAAX protease family)
MLQKGAYGIGKVIQFAFPLFFVLLIRKECLQFRGLDTSGLVLAVGFGLLVAGAMLGLYFLWLKPAGLFASVIPEVQEKLKGFGVNSLAAYAVLAVFCSLVNSLLEEYYWRWFVFGRLRNITPLTAAV